MDNDGEDSDYDEYTGEPEYIYDVTGDDDDYLEDDDERR
jgi:hypothetical protein